MMAGPGMGRRSAASRGAAAGTAAARAASLEDSLFSSDTDDEDETPSFLPTGASGPSVSISDLFRSMPLRSRTGAGPPGIVVGGGYGVHPIGFPMFGHPPPTTTAGRHSRSYASNGGDQTAGRQAENPLEIDDDSDDDEDDVEVVQVRRPI